MGSREKTSKPTMSPASCCSCTEMSDSCTSCPEFSARILGMMSIASASQDQDQSCARARSCEEEEEGGGMRGGGGYEAEENLKKGVSEVKPSSFWR